MEATQGHPNLLSEKQAAKRLGVARITLLRAREAGRIRFSRIGGYYCQEQLKEFLKSCERNSLRRNQAKGREAKGQAARKENRVSSGRGSTAAREKAHPNPKAGLGKDAKHLCHSPQDARVSRLFFARANRTH